jgi:hypothetical protein
VRGSAALRLFTWWERHRTDLADGSSDALHRQREPTDVAVPRTGKIYQLWQTPLMHIPSHQFGLPTKGSIDLTKFNAAIAALIEKHHEILVQTNKDLIESGGTPAGTNEGEWRREFPVGHLPELFVDSVVSWQSFTDGKLRKETGPRFLARFQRSRWF